MKRIITYIIMLIYSFTICLAETEIDGILYKIKDAEKKEAMVAGYTEAISTNAVEIPSEVTIEGTVYEVTRIEDNAFANCTELSTIVMPSTIKSIGDKSFSYCENLENIEIPENVDSIGISPFIGSMLLTNFSVHSNNQHFKTEGGILYSYDGRELITCLNSVESVTILETVKSIRESAFENCVYLTSLTLPNSVETLNGYTFSYCISLLEIKLPKSLKKIGDMEFNSCFSLTNITLPDSLNEINYSAFSRCQKLKAITLPASIEKIGSNAFTECSSLKKIEFLGCTDLSESSIFAGCDSLEMILNHCLEPIECNNYTFDNYTIPLYVPEKSIETYKGTTGWKNFTTILPLEDVTEVELTLETLEYRLLIENETLTISSEKECEVDIFQIDGKLIHNIKTSKGENSINLEKGIYFLKIGKAGRKIIIK